MGRIAKIAATGRISREEIISKLSRFLAKDYIDYIMNILKSSIFEPRFIEETVHGSTEYYDYKIEMDCDLDELFKLIDEARRYRGVRKFLDRLGINDPTELEEEE